ncbi:MAG: exo-alpha-sialidase [Clostridia bacterium]|nr:exo-alpha-sialidase [Clostridia bacterium]
MKKILSKIFVCILSLTLLLPAVPATAAETSDDGYFHSSRVYWETVWNRTSDGGKYQQHRIPGVVVTKQGTVIIYCEARTHQAGNYSGGDWNLMDIYIQRSTDGGVTFGDPIYIAKGEGDYKTVNNPVMIVGNDGTLHMLYCRNYSLAGGGLWYRKSTDDGLTWSTAREVTQYASSKASFNCFAFGPTHGICTTEGTLMVPVWYVPTSAGKPLTDHGPSKTAVFYSKDNGATWAMTDAVSNQSNETCIAELPDGSIILNSRATPYRRVSVGDANLENWSKTIVDEALPDPNCCGGMVSVNLEGYPNALLFVNCHNNEDSVREFVTVKCSFDNGLTWSKSVQLSNDFIGGYADIAVDEKGCVYVLYETNYGETMRLARFSFVDKFCNDAAAKNKDTAVVFDDFDTASTTSTFSKINVSHQDHALHLVKRANEALGKFTLNYAETTLNTDMSENKYMVCRVKATADANVKLGAYFLSGRVSEASEAIYAETALTADGQYHNVVVDLSSLGLKNTLQKIQFTLSSAVADNTAEFTVDLQGVAFFKTAEAAAAYEFTVDTSDKTDDTTTEPITQAPDTPATEPSTSQNGGEEKSGCGSALEANGVLLLGLMAVLALTVCIKKRPIKNKS